MKPNTVHENIELKPFNTLGVSAKARFYAAVENGAQLQQILLQQRWQTLPKFTLGGGSNILFTQDFDGLVLHARIPGIEVVSENDNFVQLRIGSGENWHQLVLHCVGQGYGGIENLALIPGCVGAAPIQNIGAYGAEQEQCFVKLHAIDLNNGELCEFNHHDCQFGYRDSIFKHTPHKNRYFITHVEFKLSKKPTFNTSYATLASMLKEMQVTALSLEKICKAIIKIRNSKLPDPKKIHNAGSFFKNPKLSKPQFAALKTKFPDIPSFPSAELIKVPAGWLIEQCGFKGYKDGHVGVYPKQALVLINLDGATGHEILALAQKIKHAVHEKFAIALEPEVNIL